MSGTYNATVRTPIGVQRGTITFVNESGMLRGSIRAMGRISYFKNGKIDGNSFEFFGNLNSGFFNLRYNAKGTVDGDILKAVATTNFGTFQITGTRVA